MLMLRSNQSKNTPGTSTTYFNVAQTAYTAAPFVQRYRCNFAPQSLGRAYWNIIRCDNSGFSLQRNNPFSIERNLQRDLYKCLIGYCIWLFIPNMHKRWVRVSRIQPVGIRFKATVAVQWLHRPRLLSQGCRKWAAGRQGWHWDMHNEMERQEMKAGETRGDCWRDKRLRLERQEVKAGEIRG